MSSRTHRIVAIVAALLLLVTMVSLSRDFGFTWDERFQQKYGEQIWDYLHGRVPRATFDTDEGNQYLYGGLFEIVAVAAQHALPSVDPYVVRHAVNSVWGWAGIVICGLAAGHAFGRRAGWIGAALLTAAPRYVGDAMNNPKDIPFAAAAMAVLGLTLTMDWRCPRLTWLRAAALTGAIAVGIGIRPLGLVLLLYSAGVIGLASLVWAVAGRGAPARPPGSAASSREPGAMRTLAMNVGWLALIAAVAIPAGSIFWPYAQAQPYVRPLTAFVKTTQLDWARGFDVLFDGQNLGAGDLPWTYVPVWLGISLPPVILVGVVASWLVVRRGLQEAVAWLGLLAFAAAPVLAAIVRHATIYDGIRHLLFVIPPIVALSAAGWSAVASTRARAVALLLLAVGIAEPVLFQLRNHPNQIVYFSPAIGGPKHAFARYDMDYWGNSVLQAVAWADEVARASGVPLVVSGNPIQAVDANGGRFRALQVVPRAASTYHLDIRLMRGPSGALKEFAARPDILYTVATADGTPLCIVIPGPAFLQVSDRLKLRRD
ncbi:MAG: hypothetical protein JSU08_15075 [Acidobacteria bacterium]|nr:hypothetical protein [Acidobacteriota bacterium]